MDILGKIEMFMDIDRHPVTMYSAGRYNFMSIKKVDRITGRITGNYGDTYKMYMSP